MKTEQLAIPLLPKLSPSFDLSSFPISLSCPFPLLQKKKNLLTNDNKAPPNLSSKISTISHLIVDLSESFHKFSTFRKPYHKPYAFDNDRLPRKICSPRTRLDR